LIFDCCCLPGFYGSAALTNEDLSMMVKDAIRGGRRKNVFLELL
jgi:hypothetical protein